MSEAYFKKILELQKRMIQDEKNKGFDFDNLNLLKWIEGELEEVKEEMKEKNSVRLEDELGDVFWTYMRLLYSLEEQGYITLENVFRRLEKKFEERIDAVENGISWEEIKKRQKEAIKKEHNDLYNS